MKRVGNAKYNVEDKAYFLYNDTNPINRSAYMSDLKGFEPLYDDSKETDTIIFGKVKSNPDGSTYRKVELLIDEKISYISGKNAETVETPTDFAINENITFYYISAIT